MQRPITRRGPRAFVQGRDKDSDDKRWYSPLRDITVVYVKKLRAAFHSVDPPSDPAITDLMEKLGVTREMMGSLANAYGTMVTAVNRRKDALSWWSTSPIRTSPANVVLGLVMLDLITEEYLQSCGETQHDGEDDPNDAERLEFCREAKALAAGERSTWGELWRRIRTAAQALMGRV